MAYFPSKVNLACRLTFALFALSHYTCRANAAEPAAEGVQFFESKIRPILVNHCYECHSAERKKSQGSLQLDTREAVLKGGDFGPALVPGDPEKSLLIRAVRYQDKDLQMPPKQQLSAAQVADLEAWIKLGAPDPREAALANVADRSKYGMSLEEGREFWSFRPVVEPPVPVVKDAAWPRTPIDHFILARLEAADVTPAPATDKQTLLRRATFYLTGLPPTLNEMKTFLADESPRAFETAVDRLLASPRYGERWGRHWLDVVRYADTCGNAADFPVPQAYKYRDWVIRAFNRDQPYDQFLREQIAGDLMTGGSDAERYERITATGYLAIARRFGGDRMGEHHLTLEDTIDNLGRAVLGSSIACARCHDHKFDPFTMSDYYGLYGIFNSTRYPFPGAEVSKVQADFVPLMSPDEVEAVVKPHRNKLSAIETEVKRLEAAEAEAKKADDHPEKVVVLASATAALVDARKLRTAVQAEAPKVNTAYAVAESTPANAKLQLRGDPKRLGSEVPRHFPAILGGQEVPEAASASGRLELAAWLTESTNPLTARVMVNRIWQQHFGQGIVQTPNDFGRQGKRPTHPELLDYLAAQFVKSGWSIKAMHRQILLSRTWQLSSVDVPASAATDPGNELFGRFTRRRLDAEAIRDSILYVSGELDESTGGEHPFPAQHTWQWSQHKPFMAVYETKRRSVYLMQQRLKKNPYLALFDGADPSSSTGVRLPSTTPLQALFMMNDPLAHQTAENLAGRAIEAESAESSRIDALYQLMFSRAAVEHELVECTTFLHHYREKLVELKSPTDQIEPKAWSALARVLLSTNEFIYVD